MPRRRLPPRVLGPYRDERYPDGSPGSWFCLTVGRRDQGESARSRAAAASEAEARRLRDALEAELEAPEDPTVRQAIELYLAAVEAKGRRERTVEAYRQRLLTFFPLAWLDRLLGDLTDRRAQALYDAQVARGVSAATHRGNLAVAKSLGAWAAHPRRGLLPKNPFAYVEPVGRVNVGKPKLRIDEARRFLDAAWIWALLPGEKGWAPVRRQAGILALLLVEHGHRASELPARVVRDLDDEGALLWISGAKNAAGNGGLEVPADLRPLLRELTRGKLPGAPLFDLVPHRQRVWYWIHRLCRVAGVPEVCPHSFRGLRADLAALGGPSPVEAAARAIRDKSPRIVARAYLEPGLVDRVKGQRAMRVIRGGKAG